MRHRTSSCPAPTPSLHWKSAVAECTKIEFILKCLHCLFEMVLLLVYIVAASGEGDACACV